MAIYAYIVIGTMTFSVVSKYKLTKFFRCELEYYGHSTLVAWRRYLSDLPA